VPLHQASWLDVVESLRSMMTPYARPRGDAPMADAAVRSKKPATSKRTPAGGAPRAAHTAAEADEPRIDVAAVTRRLLGSWADTRLEARELIKDPAFWRIEGQPMAEHRERTLGQLHLLAEAGGSRRAFP